MSRPVALGIVADARTTLEGLAGKLRDRTIAGKGRDDLKTLRAGYDAWARALHGLVAARSGPGIHPAQVCAAIGARLGAPHREVVCVTGDGASGFNVMELQAAVRWDLVAQGLGCHGELVESTAGLAAALERARQVDRPALVCVRASKDANLAVPQDIAGRFFEVYFGPAA